MAVDLPSPTSPTLPAAQWLSDWERYVNTQTHMPTSISLRQCLPDAPKPSMSHKRQNSKSSYDDHKDPGHLLYQYEHHKAY
jgi:hypothetical protein